MYPPREDHREQRAHEHAAHETPLGDDDFFERHQFDAVCRHLPEVLADLARFLYLTGWRKSECLTLQWSQVDQTDQVLRLEPLMTKNDEGRSFPYGELPELAAPIARRWAGTRALDRITPYVFHRYGGKPIKAFYGASRVACVAAGCPGRIPHDCRRTAVRALVRAAVSETVAMQLSGHKTRSVFDRYDITRDADKRAAVSQLAARTAKDQPSVPALARDATRDRREKPGFGEKRRKGGK